MAEKHKHTARIGKTRQLIFEVDTDDPDQVQMAKVFEQVAATRPASIQEFIIRLNEMQRKPLNIRQSSNRTIKHSEEIHKKKGRSR